MTGSKTLTTYTRAKIKQFCQRVAVYAAPHACLEGWNLDRSGEPAVPIKTEPMYPWNFTAT